MAKVVFLDSVHEVLFNDLSDHGYECFWDEKSTLEEISRSNHDIQGIVLRSRFVLNSNNIDIFPNLKWIARSGSGLENIDLEYCAIKGIKVFSSPEGNADAVGEYVVGALLSMLRKTISSDTTVRQNLWKREEHRGVELSSLTIAIIGLGHMGSSVAKKLSSFGCKIIAHDTAFNESPLEFVKCVTLKEIYEHADVVSIHLPLSTSNKYYANSQFFQSFKKPFFFINTARGQHCKTIDLLEAIENNSVRGAILDVIEFEGTNLQLSTTDNEVFKTLTQNQKVQLSPHIAGWTDRSYYKLSKVLSDKIRKDFSPS